MRAVVENRKDVMDVPPVEVLIAAGRENVTIKVNELLWV